MPTKSRIPVARDLGSDADDQDERKPHVLTVTIIDVMCGHVTEGVPYLVERQVGGNWHTVARGASDSSGTIMVEDIAKPGIYRIELDADAYFATVGVVSLLPRVTVTFRVPAASRHCMLRAYIAANSQFSALIKGD